MPSLATYPAQKFGLRCNSFPMLLSIDKFRLEAPPIVNLGYEPCHDLALVHVLGGKSDQ